MNLIEYMKTSMQIWIEYVEKHPEILSVDQTVAFNEFSQDLDNMKPDDIISCYTFFVSNFNGLNSDSIQEMMMLPVLSFYN